MLKELKENPYDPVLCSSQDASKRAALEAYADALATDPVGMARSLVGVCRKSGQRRNDLRAVIVEGNMKGQFSDDDGTVFALPVQELLRDCETRWSSTYNMGGRVITLYPVTCLLPRLTLLANKISRCRP